MYRVLSDLEELSYLSMECTENKEFMKRVRSMTEDLADTKVDNTCQLVNALNVIFSNKSRSWERTKVHITELLEKVDLSTNEINKFTFWDSEKPYTRNLVHTDGENYTLLILCWNAGRESSIHNHPCDGCFVKTIRGCIRESRYTIHEETKEIRPDGVKFFNEGQVILISNIVFDS